MGINNRQHVGGVLQYLVGSIPTTSRPHPTTLPMCWLLRPCERMVGVGPLANSTASAPRGRVIILRPGSPPLGCTADERTVDLGKSNKFPGAEIVPRLLNIEGFEPENLFSAFLGSPLPKADRSLDHCHGRERCRCDGEHRSIVTSLVTIMCGGNGSAAEHAGVADRAHGNAQRLCS